MRARTTVLLSAALAAAALTGCDQAAAPSASVPETTTTTSTTPCTGGTTYSDPYAAFQSSISDGAVLRLGSGPHHLGSASGDLKDYRVTGSAVHLSVQSVDTATRCGKVISTYRWIQVDTVRAGRATITSPDGRTTRVTVVPAGTTAAPTS